MKKLIFGLLFMTIGLTTIWGQPRGNRQEAREKVEAYRVEFFTKNLELTEAESEKFWTVYNDYEAKKKTIQKRNEGKRRVELMADDEVETYLTNHLENEQKLLDLKKDFFRQIKSVLPIRKVAMIPRVEKRFRKEILSEMRKRRQNARGLQRRGNR